MAVKPNWLARPSRVGTPISGREVARARPFTVLRPMRRPVKLPGPRLMAMASIISQVTWHSAMTRSRVASSRLEWVSFDSRLCSAMQWEPLTRAILPHRPEFSTARISGGCRAGSLVTGAICMLNRQRS